MLLLQVGTTSVGGRTYGNRKYIKPRHGSQP